MDAGSEYSKFYPKIRETSGISALRDRADAADSGPWCLV